MNRIAAAVLMLAVALLAWPEFGRYRAERQLGDANRRLEYMLQGLARGRIDTTGVEAAEAAARAAAAQLPGDPRAAQLLSIALMLQRRADAAREVLDAAIAAGERPELTLNLGRARAAAGDEAGAQAAFLRTAWAAPNAIDTLPKTVQATLRRDVERLEAELRAGRLEAPPGL